MSKILIIDRCWDCKHSKYDSEINSYVCSIKGMKLTHLEFIHELCTLEEEDNKLRAKWFKKGQMSIKRKNKSGCTCIIDEDLGDKITSVCGAHQTWMEEQCQRNEPEELHKLFPKLPEE